MFEKIFGFDYLLPESERVSYIFTVHHVFLALVVIGMVAGMTLVFRKTTRKTQNIMLATVAILMIVMEVGRIVWKTLCHLHEYGTLADFNYWWVISFQLCAIMTWFVSINILIYVFGKESKWTKYSLNIMVGVAMIAGILTFTYPDLIDTTRSLISFRNWQTILDHIFMIFIPVFLLSSHRVELHLKEVWIPFAGLAGAGLIAAVMSYATNNNFMFIKRAPIMESMGIFLPNPWHLVLLGIVFFAIQFVIYGSAEAIRYFEKHPLHLLHEPA